MKPALGPEVLDESTWHFIESAWEIYLNTICVQAQLTPSGLIPATSYQHYGYQQGAISATLTNQLRVTLSKTKRISFDPDTNDPQWLTSVHASESLQALRTHHQYYVLTARELWLLWQALEEMRDPIAQSLGQPWRVLSVRGWESTPLTTPSGPNNWHTDALPRLVSKIMLYLTPLTPEYGGLELQLDDEQRIMCEGDAGTWIMFQNSSILHRGLAPLNPNCIRQAIEITIAPALTFQLRPTYRGDNTRQPLIPWPTQRFIPFI